MSVSWKALHVAYPMGLQLLDVRQNSSVLKVWYNLTIFTPKIPGFYTKVKDYSVVGYKSIECIDDGKSSKWIDQFKKEVTTTNFLECVPGCDMLDNLPNAVYIHREIPSEKSGSKSLYSQGAAAIIKCKDDSVLVDGPPEDSDKPTHYECRGGPQGWLNKNTSRNEARPGDRCVPVCPIPMNLPEGVRVVTKPNEFLHKERMVVREGSTYVFRCTQGGKGVIKFLMSKHSFRILLPERYPIQ